MGSMIHLAVGRLEIEWGKNEGFRDHSALFQGEADVADVPERVNDFAPLEVMSLVSNRAAARA